jgi:serine/threonine protein kinase
MEDIENEAQAVSTLCGRGTSLNIVEVVRHGWLPRDSSYYFIDMELCSLTLEQYMQGDGANFTHTCGRTIGLNTFVPLCCLLKIGCDIANGLTYLHGLDAVHRDLKPRNGITLPFRLN